MARAPLIQPTQAVRGGGAPGAPPRAGHRPLFSTLCCVAAHLTLTARPCPACSPCAPRHANPSYAHIYMKRAWSAAQAARTRALLLGESCFTTRLRLAIPTRKAASVNVRSTAMSWAVQNALVCMLCDCRLISGICPDTCPSILPSRQGGQGGRARIDTLWVARD